MSVTLCVCMAANHDICMCIHAQNKEETEAYLRQLEAEGRGEDVYGKVSAMSKIVVSCNTCAARLICYTMPSQGVQLIVPTEAFVLKTKDTKKGTKVFINVCTSEKVGHSCNASVAHAQYQPAHPVGHNKHQHRVYHWACLK